MKNSNQESSFVSSFSCCSSYVFHWVLIPLIVVSGFVCIAGPKTSSWASLDYYSSWLCRSGVPLSSSSSDVSRSSIFQSTTNNKSSSSTEESQKYVGLHTEVVGTPKVGEEVIFDVSTLNQSSSPTLIAQEIVGIHQPEEGLQGPTNASDITINTTRDVRNYTKLDKLEAGLSRARVTITQVSKNGTQIVDPDYIPQGPMYRNARSFQRSYLEMEKQFKVFVYEEGEPPLFHNGPCKSIYSSEGNFIHLMEVEPRFRTRDPDKAHVYFLPFSVTMMVHYVYVKNSHDISPIKQTVTDYVNVVATKYPYWNRSLGADHFILSCHDWGPVTSTYIPYMYKNSIRALCNANMSEGFQPSKDVSFPEINLKTGDIKGWIGGPSPSHRPILAFFAGGLHGPIRPILFEHWKNKDSEIQVYEKLPGKMIYQDMMKKSKFCICPSGYEVASPRIVEAIYAGCIPVLISDNYVPPFSDVLNWKSFSVEVPVSRIPELKGILTSISQSQYIRMQRRLRQIRKHFEVNSPPKRFDVFYMILHSIWLRRLNVRIHELA